jgi:flagellar hook-basal body complex protein FliE
MDNFPGGKVDARSIFIDYGECMKMAGIDSSRIDAMVAQLKATAAKMEAGSGINRTEESDAPKRLDFADALKASLDQVNKVQLTSQQLGEKFALGDDKVSLSDVMISMQKANISFQTTVQVRNKLITAYHDIMNMQI